MYPVCRGTQGKTVSSVPYADMIHSCVQCTVLLSASPRPSVRPPCKGHAMYTVRTHAVAPCFLLSGDIRSCKGNLFSVIKL